ncbi:hypothetical protein BG006_000689 [Podila minutissima]|uniref:Beta-lactamase-related domain-containing protein n=1 Tax=Podila minutissima TaxID=64525 RepID=A0A9P5VH51_9FUNG|nr:hypothetical protein BG006_000689 [Podila minutissima]
MADKGTTPGARGSFFPRLTLFGWFLRLLPAIFFGLYTYSHRGAFQPPLCVSFLYGCPRVPIHIEGLMERADHYSQVVSYLLSLYTKNEDLGGSLAVFVDGRPVIDIYAGFKDLEQTVRYDNRTLQQVYSSGKVVEGIVVARLVQQGKLDYKAKVSEYWPEFGQNGKEDVTLVDLMVHESGVSHLDDDEKELTWAHLKDDEKFSERLAGQKHAFDGEKVRSYHAITRGWYLNEIVRRVDPKGRSIGQIAEQELMNDYKDVELYYSSFPNDSDWEERLSPMHDYPFLRLVGRVLLPQFLQNSNLAGFPTMRAIHPWVWDWIKGKTYTARAMAPAMAPMADSFRTKEAHAVESTSFSLKTNAHSLAKLLSMMANKGAAIKPNEPDLLDRATYELATSLHSNKPCKVTKDTLPLSTGGWVKTTEFLGAGVSGPLQGVEVQGWAGAGGSIAVWIEELGISFAYVTNAFGAPESILGDYRGKTLLDRVVYARKDELGLLPPKKVKEEQK